MHVPRPCPPRARASPSLSAQSSSPRTAPRAGCHAFNTRAGWQPRAYGAFLTHVCCPTPPCCRKGPATSHLSSTASLAACARMRLQSSSSMRRLCSSDPTPRDSTTAMPRARRSAYLAHAGVAYMRRKDGGSRRERERGHGIHAVNHVDLSANTIQSRGKMRESAFLLPCHHLWLWN